MPGVLPDLLLLLAGLAAFAAVAALVMALVELGQQFSERYLASLGGEASALAQGADRRQAAMSGAMLAFRKTVIAFLAAIAERVVPERVLAALRVRLSKAGFPHELTASELVAFQAVSFGFFLVMGALVSVWLEVNFVYGDEGLDLTGAFVTLGLGLLGALYPVLWLSDRVRDRQHKIVRALPYNLDLLTLSVEAGLDFTAAIGKVVEKGRKGPLADEFGVMLRELKLGKTREEGLRNLGARVDLPNLTVFVNALIQADKMGTPLGKILRILSTQMRIERTQRAEKLANEAPVKMLGPLIGFIFPTIFLILFGPIFYQVFYGGAN